MELLIASHIEADFLARNGKLSDFALIQFIDATQPSIVDVLAARRAANGAAHAHTIEADDLWSANEHGVAPSQEQIIAALAFAELHCEQSIICCCHAGISRSSAMAVLVGCQKVGVLETLMALDLNRHYPNPLIIEHGAEFLGHDRLVRIMDCWRELADAVNGEPVLKKKAVPN